MKKLFIIIVLPLIAIFLLQCTGYQQPAEETQVNVVAKVDPVVEGEYLITVMGCHDCHSPKQMTDLGPTIIPELAWSGYPAERELPDLNTDALQKGWGLYNHDLTAFVGPWGVSFAANLTSDVTGIGTWSEEQFKISLVEGWYKGVRNSRKLLPPMPYQNLADLRDEDVHVLYEYLQSTKPVSNVPPQPIPPAR
jgi:hypothetical protein